VALAAEMGLTVDANRATLDDWLRLPGISIHQARTLVNLRYQGVTYAALEDVATALGVPPATLYPIAPAIAFRYYDAPVIPPVDLNRATVEDLLRVPGMPPDWAEWIVRSRQWGPFRDLAEFQRRCQVPPVAMERWLHYLRVGT
jgi:DNA uptake protein ComE-like DNA-binding protein